MGRPFGTSTAPAPIKLRAGRRVDQLDPVYLYEVLSLLHKVLLSEWRKGQGWKIGRVFMTLHSLYLVDYLSQVTETLAGDEVWLCTFSCDLKQVQGNISG